MGWAGCLAQVEVCWEKAKLEKQAPIGGEEGNGKQDKNLDTGKRPEVRNGTREGAQREVGTWSRGTGGGRCTPLEAGRLTGVAAVREGRKEGRGPRKEGRDIRLHTHKARLAGLAVRVRREAVTQLGEPEIADWGLATWFARLVPEQKLMDDEPSRAGLRRLLRPLLGAGQSGPPEAPHSLLRALHKVSRFILSGPSEV